MGASLPQELSSGLQPNSDSENIFQVVSSCSQSLSYCFLEGMRLEMGVSPCERGWSTGGCICAKLVEQILDFRGMKSSALPSTCCMKQGPNGCLMMSGGNWWKNREKLKHVGVELFSFFFSRSLCFASELFQLFTFFRRSSSVVTVIFTFSFLVFSP